MIRLICYAHSEIDFTMRRQHVRMTRDHTGRASFDITFLENPCEYPHKLYTARNYSFWSTRQLLQNWSICIHCYAIVVESQEKVFQTSVNARPHCPLTFSFYRTRPNIRTNLIPPETRVPAEDLHCWHYVSIFIIFRAIIFRSRTVSASQTGAKT